MDPREFQSLASKLSTGTCAAEFRTAISRAYYAAYNVSVELLRGMGFTVSRGSSGHGEVQNRLGNSGNIEVMKVGSKLGTLQGKRIRADYRLDRVDIENPKTTEAIVKEAGEMIQVLDTLISEPKRSQIIKAIQEWEQKISKTWKE